MKIRHALFGSLLVHASVAPAQSWTAVPTQESQAGKEQVSRLAWIDALGRPWSMSWVPDGDGDYRLLLSCANHSFRDLGRGFPPLHGHFGPHFEGALHSRSNLNWQVFEITGGTGRVNIPLSISVLIVLDLKTRAWRADKAWVRGEGGISAIIGKSLRVDFAADGPANTNTATDRCWVYTTSASIKRTEVPQDYRWQGTYPGWPIGPSSVGSPDPQEAVQWGYQSWAWHLQASTSRGGTAESFAPSLNTADPRSPVVTPKEGSVQVFAWSDRVALVKGGKELPEITPSEAARLTETGDWDVILTHQGGSDCFATYLIAHQGRFSHDTPPRP